MSNPIFWQDKEVNFKMSSRANFKMSSAAILLSMLRVKRLTI